MPFCENCGYKVSISDRFCENCGHSISQETNSNNKPSVFLDYNLCFNLFASSEWKQKWLKAFKDNINSYRGIILTNTQDCPDNLKESFFNSLKSYMTFRAESGAFYFVLDLANQAVKHPLFSVNTGSVDFVVGILKEIYKAAPWQCTMIVGDKNAVPSIKWKNALHIEGNHNSDSDTHVDSDLPYVTLDTASPFESNSFTFKLEVGRIPSVAKKGFLEAQRYFSNTLIHSNNYAPVNAVVLSAQEWANTSQISYAINKKLFPCPPFSFVPPSYVPFSSKKDVQVLDNDCDYNLLCFNLHGCNDGYAQTYDLPEIMDDFWLSGDGHVGYAPKFLPSNKNISYVISTEACYGAKPYIREGANQSILMTALQNRCIGYLGSTQIAYGTTDAIIQELPPHSADVISGTFAKALSQGYTTGQAYFKAVSATVSHASGDYITPHDIKTIASFALYGDPTLSIMPTIVTHSFALEENHLHVPIPDVRRMVEAKLSEVLEYIAKNIDEYIKRNFAFFSDVTPTYCTIKNHSGYNVTYAKSLSNIPHILSMYLDESGNVQKIYVSK